MRGGKNEVGPAVDPAGTLRVPPAGGGSTLYELLEGEDGRGKRESSMHFIIIFRLIKKIFIATGNFATNKFCKDKFHTGKNWWVFLKLLEKFGGKY